MRINENSTEAPDPLREQGWVCPMCQCLNGPGIQQCDGYDAPEEDGGDRRHAPVTMNAALTSEIRHLRVRLGAPQDGEAADPPAPCAWLVQGNRGRGDRWIVWSEEDARTCPGNGEHTVTPLYAAAPPQDGERVRLLEEAAKAVCHLCRHGYEAHRWTDRTFAGHGIARMTHYAANGAWLGECLAKGIHDLLAGDAPQAER